MWRFSHFFVANPKELRMHDEGRGKHAGAAVLPAPCRGRASRPGPRFLPNRYNCALYVSFHVTSSSSSASSASAPPGPTPCLPPLLLARSGTPFALPWSPDRPLSPRTDHPATGHG